MKEFETTEIKIGRTDYEERKENRIERLNNAAERAITKSTLQYQYSHDLVKDIPFGQPNIEGRTALPNLRKKSWNALEHAIENEKKAEYYSERALSAENNSAISSDNPDALMLLEKKFEKLTSSQELMKKVNTYYRKNKTCVGCECISDEYAKELDVSMKTAYSWETAPFPSYRLTNNNATIKATQERINSLKRIGTIEEQEFTFENGTIKVNKDDNRVQIYFDSIPNEDTRKTLKSYGFKWAPSVKAWQMLISIHAIRYAKRACGIE